jgi:hypothetical protein
MTIDFDRRMLGDTVRNEAYAKALKSVIKPGETTVTDMGAGTGFLGFIASKLGAKECFLYEFASVAQLAKDLAIDNQLKNCKIIMKHTSEVKNPEQTDVVVTETFGNFALEEHLIENLNDAKRFLKPGGVIIPSKTEQLIAPVTSSRLFDELMIWDNVGHDLNFSRAKEMCLNNMYVKTIKPDELMHGMKSAQVFNVVDSYENLKSQREGSVEWTIDKAATVYGFAVWWNSELVKGVELSTSPDSPMTHWEQIYLPVLEPIELEKDDLLKVSVSSDSSYKVGINVAWTIEVIRDRKNVIDQEMSMEKGMLQ